MKKILQDIVGILHMNTDLVLHLSKTTDTLSGLVTV